MFFTTVPNEITSFIALALVIFFSAALLRSRILTVAVGLPAVLGFLSYSSFIPVASVVAVIGIIGMGAVALLHTNKVLVALSFAVAFGASLFFTKSPLASAVMLLYALCAVLLAGALSRGMRRSSSICLVATCLLFGFAVVFLVGLWRLVGELNREVFSALISEMHELLLESFMESAALFDESIRPIMTEETFNAAFDTALCTLPAITILSVCGLAFLAHLLSFMICTASGYMQKIPEESRPLVLSPVTAILYIVSFLLLLLAPFVAKDSDILLWTAQNMTLILMFPLLLIGTFGILGFLSQNAGCLNVWVIMGLILLALYSRGLLLYPVSFFGVYLTFRVNRRQPKKD